MKTRRIFLAFAALALLLAGCGRGTSIPADPAARAPDARAAFEKILDTQLPFLAWYSYSGVVEWKIPTGGEIAFAGDPSKDDQTEAFGVLADVSMDIDPEYFVEAGLDLDALYFDPSGHWSPGMDTSFGQRMRINANFGAEAYPGASFPAEDVFKDGAKAPLLAIFDGILKNHPERLLADPARNLYGFDLGQGDSLWWTRDRAGTKKDIIIRLNPKPLVAAGMDASKYLGWERVGPDGKKAEPDDPAMALERSNDSFDD